jgi:fumarylacetoacetate (FAA) hydrolase
MAYGFHDLIAHAARTRDLPAGTIIGSGTVSNANHAEVGSTCLSERRAIDTIAGRPVTSFLRFGDRVTMQAGDTFGRIDQRVVKR